jgi:hypothetical protein
LGAGQGDAGEDHWMTVLRRREDRLSD